MNFINSIPAEGILNPLRSCLVFAGLSFLLCACEAQAPEPGAYDLGVHTDLWVQPDGTVSCEERALLAAPTMDLHPEPTLTALQPFRGVAPGAFQVTASLGDTTFRPVSVAQNGRFCLEAQLISDAVNSVTFTPWDENACPGESTTITITHKSGDAPTGGGITTPQNLALERPGNAKHLKAGQHADAVDGNPKTTVEFKFKDREWWPWQWDDYGWMSVDLGKEYTVTQIRLLYAPDVGSNYAKYYRIYLSAEPAPSDATPGGAGWESVREVSNGNADTQKISIAPTKAHWVGVRFYEDSKDTPIVNWFTKNDEKFRLGELEVIGQDHNAKPPLPHDSCE